MTQSEILLSDQLLETLARIAGYSKEFGDIADAETMLHSVEQMASDAIATAKKANTIGIISRLRSIRDVLFWQEDTCGITIEAKAELDKLITELSHAPVTYASACLIFDDNEIHGFREYWGAPFGQRRYCEQVSDEEAQFWSLYGHIPGQGLECIGDFKTREHAEEAYARITGRRYGCRSSINRQSKVPTL
jgi:hypothetical protein